MRLSFRRPAEPAPAPLDKDALISQLSHDKAALRVELDRVRDELVEANRLVAYQRDRMNDMAKENLGLLADRTYLAALVRKLSSAMQRHLNITLPEPPPAPSTVDTPPTKCPVCPHLRDEHDEWGCNGKFHEHALGQCRCLVAPIHFYRAKART